MTSAPSSPPGPPPVLASLVAWPAVEAALPAEWRAPVVAWEPVTPNRVWKVRLADARALALKLAAAGAPLEVEAGALAWVHARRGAVPAVLAASDSSPVAWLALEWAGDHTLDEVVPDLSTGERQRLGIRLAETLGTIETCFAPLGEQLRRRPNEWQLRVTTLQAQMEPWLQAAPSALHWLTGEVPVPDAERALSEVIVCALAAAPTTGPLDYNPRNVVLNRVESRESRVESRTPVGIHPGGGIEGERLTIVDYSSIGLDWPQRRVAQYATATARGFASALSPSAARAFAGRVAPIAGEAEDTVCRQIDAHEALLLLTAAAQLRLVGEGRAHTMRSAAWQDVAARRAQLQALLARPLAADGPAAELRLLVREQVTRR